ncbi:MAG: phosphorylase [Deltaproteobacteria bacterium]|nr:phosphorylase [Deltaproteobacteria bacterium]
MKARELKLKPGTLWQKTLERTEQALRTGALLPIYTESTFMNDGGIDFLVRIVSNLARKSEERNVSREKNSTGKNKPNPFLPYEEDLFVADISDTHVCFLNKFNVIEHHLLIVTRVFEDQEILLTLQDFEAIRACIAEFEGLVFYNGGVVAGASQQHKHLQMIPLPMEDAGLKMPVEPLFAGARFEGDLGVLPGFPFVHSFARIDQYPADNISDAAEDLYKLYRRMIQAVDLNHTHESEDSRQSGPYNLLFTREWMLLVPRSEEFFGSISINALGFAGALLVQDEKQMQILKENGGMAVLRHAGIDTNY